VIRLTPKKVSLYAAYLPADYLHTKHVHYFNVLYFHDYPQQADAKDPRVRGEWRSTALLETWVEEESGEALQSRIEVGSCVRECQSVGRNVLFFSLFLCLSPPLSAFLKLNYGRCDPQSGFGLMAMGGLGLAIAAGAYVLMSRM
jgi:hypothetical protein